MGAADVVPFIPLEGTTMEDCIVLARALGERVGRELQIPVFLYERAAPRPDRENLADVRRGEFEGLREQIGKDATRAPDFGPSRIHPTAGAVAIGARPFLVAYNVYLGPATNVQVAKDVAKALRHSTGGLRYVKALGLEVDGQAQVSMNLVDTEKTPLFRAFEMVRLEAALVQMVAGLTAGKKKYAAVDAEMRALALDAAGLVTQLSSLVTRDAAAFAAVSAAYKLPNEPADAATRRKDAVTKALLGAAQVPLETARACARAADLAIIVATKGNTNAASDAGVAALLAEAGCRGATLNVRINVASLDDKSLGAGLLEEAKQLVAQTSDRARTAIAAVEAQLSS